ncbi:hypothetical protein AX16_001152 [Volvariella volvacea WC 439]|nr:hypothetical protein AX16_001152 [Volvariella volvacea WC 439]
MKPSTGPMIMTRPITKLRTFTALLLGASLALTLLALASTYDSGSASSLFPFPFGKHKHRHGNPAERKRLHDLCKALHAPAGPHHSYNPHTRIKKGSERYVPGTPPTLLRNARIWTGGKNGTEVIQGDILLDRGVIVRAGHVPRWVLAGIQGKIEVIDVNGKWITPGLVDLHSHIGVGSSPELRGADDTNSIKAPILPWLRSVDALNTHDDSYELSVAGGVTTAQILPGSANNIGGQSFLIKLRPTEERSTMSLLLEPPHNILSPELRNATGTDKLGYTPWRHMKHACGENPSRVHSQTRMDSAWEFRRAYNEAKKLKKAQDDFCERVKAEDDMTGHSFPENLQWEALVDVLRGKVKLSVHCYEAVDLDAIVRLSNEFQFPVASFHHAGETYLVPELLKKTWGGAPAVALFASNARKKREAYRASEFAPRILAEHGISVVMKSDHPVVNSRYLLYEAQLAHYYGLPPNLALASVITVPAQAAGVGQRLGLLKPGYDADLVIWDSHPLTLGATPTQVYIDGIKQFSSPSILDKPPAFQDVPQIPNWDKEAQEVVSWQGLPPLEGKKSEGELRSVRFANVSAVYVENVEEESIEVLFESSDLALDGGGSASALADVVFKDGRIACISSELGGGLPCPHTHSADGGKEEEIVIDLQGGTLAPGLSTFGSPLGLVEIRLEASTNDGKVVDPLTNPHGVSPILGDLDGEDVGVVRAVDGLQFGGRNALLAYRGGITKSITAPSNGGSGLLLGLSTAFDLGAENVLEDGAILEEEVALHVYLDMGLKVSVSTQVATLRRLLFNARDSGEGAWARVREGHIPLVAHVENADIMATLISLKREYQSKTKKSLQLTFAGATESHLIAKEIASAGVSVILTSRPFPAYWSQRRILPGPPLTQESIVTTLLAAGVNVAIGVVNEYDARNTRFDLGWLALESNGTLSRAQTLALSTVNLNKALGLGPRSRKPGWPRIGLPDFVAYRGGSVFELTSKVVGVVSPRKKAAIVF